MSEQLKESLKELARVIVLAIVPVLVVSLENYMNGISFDFKIILISIGIAILRAIDKYIHLNEPEGVSGGLVRF